VQSAPDFSTKHGETKNDERIRVQLPASYSRDDEGQPENGVPAIRPSETSSVHLHHRKQPPHAAGRKAMTINIYEAATILVCHFVGDFIIQTQWQAANKSKRRDALGQHDFT